MRNRKKTLKATVDEMRSFLEIFLTAGGIYLFMTFLIHNLVKYLERKYSFN